MAKAYCYYCHLYHQDSKPYEIRIGSARQFSWLCDSCVEFFKWWLKFIPKTTRDIFA